MIRSSIRCYLTLKLGRIGRGVKRVWTVPKICPRQWSLPSKAKAHQDRWNAIFRVWHILNQRGIAWQSEVFSQNRPRFTLNVEESSEKIVGQNEISFYCQELVKNRTPIESVGLLPHSRLTVEEQEAVIMEEYRLSSSLSSSSSSSSSSPSSSSLCMVIKNQLSYSPSRWYFHSKNNRHHHHYCCEPLTILQIWPV